MFTKHLHNVFLYAVNMLILLQVTLKTGPQVIFMIARLLRTALITMIYGLGFFPGTF